MRNIGAPQQLHADFEQLAGIWDKEEWNNKYYAQEEPTPGGTFSGPHS
ncbi:hypothetical protein LLA49_003629 [Salmonella enterica]|nr:hypothetical protein [Salmonella enterica]